MSDSSKLVIVMPKTSKEMLERIKELRSKEIYFEFRVSNIVEENRPDIAATFGRVILVRKFIDHLYKNYPHLYELFKMSNKQLLQELYEYATAKNNIREPIKNKLLSSVNIKKTKLTHAETCWINKFKFDTDYEKKWNRKYCLKNKIRLSDFYGINKRHITEEELENIIPYLEEFPKALTHAKNNFSEGQHKIHKRPLKP